VNAARPKNAGSTNEARDARRGPNGRIPDWPAALISPSKSQEGGNEPSCRDNGAEFDTLRPIPPRAAGGLLQEGQGAPEGENVSGAEGAGVDRRSRPQGGAAAHPALPCQNRNNSNKEPKRYRLQPVHGSKVFFKTKDNDRAVWKKVDGDVLVRLGMPSAAEAKAAFHLRRNVASFINHFGRNHCLFFTITDQEGLHPSQFARRWNSYLAGNGKWIRSFIRVLEPQAKGRPHYHLLVAVDWDTRPDIFDWEAFDACQFERNLNGYTSRFRELRARYKNSAAPELAALWSLQRKVLPRYGLGRAELLPLRKGEEAISEYIGKYLEGGLNIRRHSWKGCRRIEFDRRAKDLWLCCSRVFSWNSPGAKQWRKRVGDIAEALGVLEIEGITRRLGSRWAYHFREAITLSDDVKWNEFLSSVPERAFLLMHNPSS